MMIATVRSSPLCSAWISYGATRSIFPGPTLMFSVWRISEYAEIRQTENIKVGPGKIDLVAPYEIHAEQSGDERTVAIIIRAEKSGGFLQGRYDPATHKYWQGYGPKQLAYELK